MLSTTKFSNFNGIYIGGKGRLKPKNMFWLFFLCFILGGIGGAILFNLYLNQKAENFLSELKEISDGNIRIEIINDEEDKKENQN